MSATAHLDTPPKSASALYALSNMVIRPGGQRGALKVLWRRRALIAVIVLLWMTLTVLTVNRVTPLYTATAKVMLVSPDENITNTREVVRSLRFDRYTMRGEIEVLKSRGLINRLVDNQNLDESKFFNPALAPKPLIDIQAWLGALRDLITPTPPPPANADPEAIAKAQRNALIDAVLASLDVHSATLSPVVDIRFTTDDPIGAANLANALANLYVYNQLESKFDTTRKATVWLNDRLDGLRDQVRASERAVEQFRDEHGLIGGDKSAFTTENLSDLNARFIVAQAERAEAQARYTQVKRVLDSGRALEATADVLKSPVVQRLLDQESQLNRKIAELDARYGERHPKMIDAKSELDDLQRKLKNEVSKIASALDSELRVIQTRERALRDALDNAEARASSEGRASVTLRELEREAEANRLIYENFLSRFKETSQQESIQKADARVISEAAAPSQPSKPRKRVLFSVSLVAALLLAIMVALLLESFDRGLKSAEEIEALTGLPVLAMVADAGSRTSDEDKRHYPLSHPLSAIAESIRTLYTSLRLASPDQPIKRIAFTSSMASEGKSTTCLWLAEVAADQGRRVVIVDCDLRRPKLHQMLGLANDVGVTEVVTGDASLHDAIQTDARSGVHVLTGKAVHGNALELLGSESFSKLVDELARDYDLVMLDAPPVLAVSDVRVISRLVETTAFLVRWNRTDAKAVLTALKQYVTADTNLLGIVVTQVNTRQHSRYGYGDYGHYYGREAGYYHEG